MLLVSLLFVAVINPYSFLNSKFLFGFASLATCVDIELDRVSCSTGIFLYSKVEFAMMAIPTLKLLTQSMNKHSTLDKLKFVTKGFNNFNNFKKGTDKDRK